MPIGALATCFGTLEYTGGIVKVFAIIWALVFGYFSFKILWSRAKDLLTEVDTNKYFVIPALAHYLRTYGEVFGAVCFTIPIFLIGVYAGIMQYQGRRNKELRSIHHTIPRVTLLFSFSKVNTQYGPCVGSTPSEIGRYGISERLSASVN